MVLVILFSTEIATKILMFFTKISYFNNSIPLDFLGTKKFYLFNKNMYMNVILVKYVFMVLIYVPSPVFS